MASQSAQQPSSAPGSGETVTRMVIANGWARPDQVKQAEAFIAAAASEPKPTLQKVLLQQKALTGEQLNELEQLIRQQEELPGFNLLKKLGAGGMGTVFLAKHNASGQEVALKIINRRLADDSDFLGRFHRETTALIDLRHPHLANVIANGTSGSTHFLAMEYINGPSLGAMLQEFHALPEIYVLNLVSQVAEGLAFVYDKSGLVHRDVKPENILVNRTAEALAGEEIFPDDDSAKLIDFGLVKTANDDQHLTQTGMTIGTPLYMSPEQVRGEKLDCRSDIYGLGATMFHLLTGIPPFRGSSPGAIMSGHLTEPVPDPGDLVPSLNLATRKLVMMAMAKSPDDRYLNCAALIKNCRQILDSLREKTNNGMRLLRKPLVITKKPATKKTSGDRHDSGEESSGSADAVSSEREVGDRIAAKHREGKADLTPTIGNHPSLHAVQSQPGAADGKEGTRRRLGVPQITEPIKIGPVVDKSVSGRKSVVFEEDPQGSTGTGIYPWIMLAIALIVAGIYAYFRFLG